MGFPAARNLPCPPRQHSLSEADLIPLPDPHLEKQKEVMFGSPVLKRNQDGSIETWLVDTGSSGEHSQRSCKGTQRSGLQGLLTESDFSQKRNSKGNLAETSALGPV